MKKSSKIIRNLILTLVVILLSIVAFIGVFVEVNGVFKNIIPSFTYGMDIDGVRELRYLLDESSEEKEVYVDDEGNIKGIVKTEETESENLGISLDTTVEETAEVATPEAEKLPYKTETREIKANPEVKTLEDFEQTKKVIQKRLSSDKSIEYNIRLDTLSNNELIIEVPNDEEQVNYVRSMIENKGHIEMIDEETGIVLMDNSMFKKAAAGVGAAQDGSTDSQIYLTMTLTKEGKETIKDISNKYSVSTDENGEDNSKTVAITMDGVELLHTSFAEEYVSDYLQIPLGSQSSDTEVIREIFEYAELYETIINSGEPNLTYALQSDHFIKSQITREFVVIIEVVFAVAILIVSIVFIIKYKKNGLLAAVLNVGYIAVLVIVSRYSDIVITLNSSLAFLGAVILNVIFMYKYLKDIKEGKNVKEAFVETFKNIYLAIVPICIIAVIFTCLGNAVIGSIGKVLFWGLLLHIVYSFLVVRNMYASK